MYLMFGRNFTSILKACSDHDSVGRVHTQAQTFAHSQLPIYPEARGFLTFTGNPITHSIKGSGETNKLQNKCLYLFEVFGLKYNENGLIITVNV